MLMFRNYLKAIRVGVLAAIFALQVGAVAPASLFAQDGDESVSTAGTARPKITSEDQVPLGRGGYDPKVFLAEGNSINQPNSFLFYEPLIFIQANHQGRLVHHIDDNGFLTLYVRWDPSPESTQEQIRRHFKEKREAPSESWVINPLVVTDAWFESSRNENIRSNPLPSNTSFTTRGDIQVYFQLDNRQATEFIAALQGQEGQRPTDQLVFKYSFEGVSEELCTADASYEDIQQIGRFRDLFGEGREGYAQRHQLARIFQEIIRTRTARGRCSDAEVLRQMTNQAMEQLDSPEPTPLEQLENYASLDNDLRSDLSESLNESSQSVSRDQDQEAFRQAASEASSAGGSVGWGPFAASLSGSFSEASEEARQMFRDVLRKHGMSGEWKGATYTPRTLDVYSKERMDSQWEEGVRIEYALTEGAKAAFPITLTQRSWLHGDQEPHEEPEALRMLEARLIQKVASVETEMKKIGERLVAVDRLLADAIVLTDQKCAVLGPAWKRYEGMGGRFPLGAGMAVDARGEERTFTISDEHGGRYSHQLTVEEMPSHSHTYTRTDWIYIGDDDNNRGVPRYTEGQWTGRTGGGQPHDNMPPYHVLNFCHKPFGEANDQGVAAAGGIDQLEEAVRRIRREVGGVLRVQTGRVHLRSEKHGRKHGDRVNFSQPFASTPEVIMAFHAIDKTGGGPLKLVVGATEIDATGFDFTFYSSDETALWDSSAVWIAVGP